MNIKDWNLKKLSKMSKMQMQMIFLKGKVKGHSAIQLPWHAETNIPKINFILDNYYF